MQEGQLIPKTKSGSDAMPFDGPEAQLKLLGITLPPAPSPLGIYTEAVQSGNLLFLTGMLPIVAKAPQYIGRIGAELTRESGRDAACTAALNGLATARAHLGSLNRIVRLVRLGVFVATDGEFREHPYVADGASKLLRDVFGPQMLPVRLVIGVAGLPLGMPVELEFIFEVQG